MFSADRSIPPLPYFALHARDEETRVTLIPYVPNVVIRDVRDRRACIYTRDACTHGGQAVCTCTGSRTNFRDRLMDDTFVCLGRVRAPHCRKMALFRPLVRNWRLRARKKLDRVRQIFSDQSASLLFFPTFRNKNIVVTL